MKRKIAAIFAADIAGYSRLVAEDEEETLRRLASYRQVTDDFIAKGGGRIFNTAGDAVLAEFPSAVEAVRCAIDIQESLRTRNMAYPPSRQMAFRIGITIGDVVERDGDLLGDGVNIAARLEGLAEVGGICISRAVHEQVANKLSVQFADIGAQEVKNIPTPVHAYMVAMRREDGTYATPQVKKPAKAQGCGAAELDVAGRGHGGQPGRDRRRRLSLFHQARDVGAVKVAAAGSARARRRRRRRRRRQPAPPALAGCQHRRPPQRPRHRRRHLRRRWSYRSKNSPPPTFPSSATRPRATLATDYAPAADFKAFSLNVGGFNAFVTGQPSEEAAKIGRGGAMPEARRRRAVAAQMRTLCGRRHRRLRARQAADAAAALDQA